VDDGSRTLVSIPLVRSGRAIELALLGVNNDPDLIRISVPGLEAEPSATELRVFDELGETFMALVRIFYRNDAIFAEPRMRYANFILDDEPPQFNITKTVTSDDPPLDPRIMKKFLDGSEELRTVVRLYADSMNVYLPIQYRYLSAYKILEHDFRLPNKKWKPTLDALLANFEAEYETLSLSRAPLRGLMFDLRDKCAHIRTGGAHKLAIVGIGSTGTDAVTKLMPLLLNIVKKHVEDNYKL
jgi:hypothetical protein